MNDIPVKCCRCRHECMQSDLHAVPYKRIPGCTQSVCPRCGCKSYYDQRPQVAWCWASGLIEVGDALPPDGKSGGGAIQIASGAKSELELALKVLARHSRTSSALLVPGVPEAEGEEAAGAALKEWLKWCVGGGKKNAKRWPSVVWGAERGVQS